MRGEEAAGRLLLSPGTDQTWCQLQPWSAHPRGKACVRWYWIVNLKSQSMIEDAGPRVKSEASTVCWKDSKAPWQVGLRERAKPKKGWSLGNLQLASVQLFYLETVFVIGWLTQLLTELGHLSLLLLMNLSIPRRSGQLFLDLGPTSCSCILLFWLEACHFCVKPVASHAPVYICF
jgi:hypothetical protein